MKLLSIKVLSITKWPNKKVFLFRFHGHMHFWGWNCQKKRILLLIMLHNVVMCIIFFCLVKKLVLINRLQKNSDSLGTWRMPKTQFDNF